MFSNWKQVLKYCIPHSHGLRTHVCLMNGQVIDFTSNAEQATNLNNKKGWSYTVHMVQPAHKFIPQTNFLLFSTKELRSGLWTCVQAVLYVEWPNYNTAYICKCIRINNIIEGQNKVIFYILSWKVITMETQLSHNLFWDKKNIVISIQNTRSKSNKSLGEDTVLQLSGIVDKLSHKLYSQWSSTIRPMACCR